MANKVKKKLKEAKNSVKRVKENKENIKTAWKYRWIAKRVQRVRSPWHIICLLLNIFLPGVGSLIACCVQRKKNTKYLYWQILFGLLQLFAAPLLVGWLLSIAWGIAIYKRSTGVMKHIPQTLTERF